MEDPLLIGFYLLMVVFLVLLNGFFVASEFAIVKVRSTRIAELERQGNKRAKVAGKIVKQLDAYLSANQLGITLASLGLGWIGEPAVARLIQPVLEPYLPATAVHFIAFVIAFSIITFLHIVLGELAPKSLAIRKAEPTTLWVAAPLHFFYKVFYPAIHVLNATANTILKWVGIPPVNEDEGSGHTDEEIRMIMVQSHRSGMIDHKELELLDNVFDFSERMAREVIVPRIDMVCLYRDDSFEDNYKVIKENKHTRYPLCGVDKDDILGVVHIHDIYEQMVEGKTPDLMKLARPILTIPETMEIKDVLTSMQKNRMEMAIVLDEYGGTSGIITIEDIVEELVGEIQGEFDDELPLFQKVDDGISIDARLLIEEVNEYFNINIEDRDNDTIGGWLFSQLQELPQVGQQARWNDYVFTVLETDNKSISRIIVRKEELARNDGEMTEAM